jgi:SAM-dependent methyltransferase
MSKCSFCKSPLKLNLIDMGKAPISNNLFNSLDCKEIKKSYKLTISICNKCWLVQTRHKVPAKKIFTKNYPYFSSFSSSLLNHSKKLVELCIERFNLNKLSLVYEIASNDGYLLQYFKKKHIPSVGVEPTLSTAKAARKKGLKIVNEFFNTSVSKQLKKDYGAADLIIANNVLAHVPKLRDFVSAHENLLKDSGIIVFEFHYLVSLIKEVQFDQIYHEHYYYYSLTSLNKILSSFNLEIFDAILLNTQGGSLRIYVKKIKNKDYKKTDRLLKLIKKEKNISVNKIKFYKSFSKEAEKIKNSFRIFLNNCKRKNLNIVGYGAAAKGITLLNYSKTTINDFKYIVDKNPAKQNKFLAASRIKIISEDILKKKFFNFIIIFPWNLKSEIIKELNNYKFSKKAKKVTFLPKFKIH